MLSKEAAIYLVLSMIFNQSCKVERAFQAPNELLKRLEMQSFDLNEFESKGEKAICDVISLTPCLHRFPANMAKYIYNSACIINKTYKSDPRNIWRGKSEQEMMKNLVSLSGIGDHKAIQCMIYLYELGEISFIPEWCIKYMNTHCSNFFSGLERDIQYITQL